MAITVSRPTAGRLIAQKLADYRLHLAASGDYLAAHGSPATKTELRRHPIVGYVPDMVFDKELDYLKETGVDAPRFASNSVAVQLQLLRQGAGIGIVHDFALPAARELRKVMADSVSLSRSFWLLRHADDRQVVRLARFADLLVRAMRREIARLEALA